MAQITLDADKIVYLEDAMKEEVNQSFFEQNARGLTQYRRVIRAQFDMFSRKYGNSLESLTVAELMERQDELLQDFADLQVPVDMLTKHPDFLNPNDPDDELLDYRIQYYSLMGKTVSDFIRSFMYLFKSEEHAKSELDFCWKTTKKTNLFSMPDSYLTQHDPTFLHSIDWKEGIRVPQEDVIGAATDAALEYGAAGVAQVLSDLLRGEDNGEAIAQQVSNAVSQAILDNGAEAAPMAAAQATAEALRLLRNKSEPDEK